MLSDSDKKFIMDFLLKKIPEPDFLAGFNATPETVRSRVVQMLQRCLDEKDVDAAQYGLLLTHRFGFDISFLNVLNELAEAPWHTAHENAVSALAKLKDPSSVPVLARVAVVHYPYKSWDKAFALNTKAIHGLWAIGNEDAIRALGDLTKNENRVIKSTAKELLRDLVKNSSSPGAKSLAKDMLKA
jgi:hypothetical protein